VGYQGDIAWDTPKPDGTPRKLLDVSKLTQSGWTSSIGLQEGIRSQSSGFKTTNIPFEASHHGRQPLQGRWYVKWGIPMSEDADWRGRSSRLLSIVDAFIVVGPLSEHSY
jgi:hypothetical protein